MKKNYLKKKLLTVKESILLGIGVFSLIGAKAQMTDLGYSTTGKFLNNVAVTQVVFGGIAAGDHSKSKDMLVVGFQTASVTAGTSPTNPFVKLYKNTGNAAGYYEAADPGNVVLIADAGINTSWSSNTLRQYTGVQAAWSKKDGKIIVVGINGTTKYSRLFAPDGSGGYAEVANPISGGGTLDGVFGYCGFGDFDGDGDDDILLYDTGRGVNPVTITTNAARIYRNNGDGTYTVQSHTITDLALQSFYSVDIADHNNDGKDDFIISGFSAMNATPAPQNTPKTAIYQGAVSAGNITFTELIPTVGGGNVRQLGAASVAFIDSDGDGKITDIIALGTEGNLTSSSNLRRFVLYKNTLATPNDYTAEFDFSTDGTNHVGFQYGMVATGDLRETGFKTDFVAQGQRNANANRAIVGLKGTSGYTLYNNYPATLTAFGTYNSNSAPNTTLFSNIVSTTTASVLRAYVFGDVDDDGKADDLVAFNHEYHGNVNSRLQTFVYKNEFTVVPITGIEFNVKAEANGAKLTWSTVTEKDNSHFTISRSTDGSTFTKLTTVTGAGTSLTAKKYEFKDNAPANGINYYKLQQLDFNGTITDLGVKSLRFGLVANAASAYPNPTKGITTLAVTAGVYDSYAVVGLQGITVAKGTVGNNVTSVGINLSSLLPGTYVIKLTGKSGNTTSRIVKL